MTYKRPFVSARENGRGRYTVDVTSEGHTIVVDEPADSGGDDLGMSPMKLLAASLAACTTITLRMYVERKAWPVEVIDTRVSHYMTEHDPEREGTPDRQGRVNVFSCEIEIEGDADDEQRQRMLTIAAHCPVHKILARESRIVSELVRAQ